MRSVLFTLGFVLVAQTVAAQSIRPLAEAEWIPVRAVPADAFTAAIMGELLQPTEPVFLVGQQPLTLAWDAPSTGVPNWYETRVGAGNLVNVGLVTTWTMPTLPVGTHTASVRACVTNGQPPCGPEASVTFRLINPTPTPTAPNAPRIIPPSQVLSSHEIRELADAFSYVHRLSGLNGQEWNYLASQYLGPIPVTYGDEMAFLNAQLLLLMAAR